jgi:hypothetical protein
LLGILIIMNNYFHDVATALLFTAGFVMLSADQLLSAHNNPGASEYFLALYHKFTGFARFALIWILVGGIPRTIFYEKYEWNPALGKGIIPALIVKHILMFTLVGFGVYFWRKLKIKAEAIIIQKSEGRSQESEVRS